MPAPVQTSAFRRQVAAAAPAETQRPPRTVILPANAWSSKYHGKPAGDVEVGLRRYAEADAVQARARASQVAWRNHPEPSEEEERAQTWNSTMMAWIVAASCCEPADQSKSFFGHPQMNGDKVGAEAVVPLALSPKGVEFLFLAVDTMLVEDAPSSPDATEEDLRELAGMLDAEQGLGGLGLPEAKLRRVRRLLGTALDILRGEG